jgi:hypothetical protein
VNHQQQFTSAVTGNSDTSVIWDVNGSVGGNGTIGFMDSISGLYTAPASIPSVSITVHATSKAAASAVGSATVTITNPTPPVTISISPSSVSVRAAGSQQFASSVKNTTNTGVTWKVNGFTGGSSTLGRISSSGNYLAPGTVPSPPTVTITAVSIADSTKSASASVTITHARR